MDMKIILIILSFFILGSCGSAPKNTLKKSKETKPSVFEPAYYQNLGKNIKRLHHLMQGTFIAYKEGASKNLESWEVSEGDSVILYNVPLGDVERQGYWVYSYEFMTSLPNEPIYTSIKQIKQFSRDSLEVLYYTTVEPTTIRLGDILDKEVLNKKIQLDDLLLRDKRVVYVKESAAHFIGYSKVYEDEQFNCLRQNKYDLSPNYYKVETAFFDKKNNEDLLMKHRPNLLVRREVGVEVLSKMASK